MNEYLFLGTPDRDQWKKIVRDRHLLTLKTISVVPWRCGAVLASSGV